MKKNKIIFIIVLILIVIGVGYLIYSSFDSHINSNVTNNSDNNKSITNSSLDVNNSLNTTDNDTLKDDSSDIETTSDDYSSYNSYSNYNDYSSSKSASKSDDEFTASDARKVVKDYLGGVDGYDISELKIGKPKLKDSDGSWLVPLYDKKTGEFVAAEYAYDDGMTHGGVYNHDDYKRVLDGKKPKKNKYYSNLMICVLNNI